MGEIFGIRFLVFFWCTACGTLIPQPGIEPAPPALKVWGLKHWTARKVPGVRYFFKKSFYIIRAVSLHIMGVF